MLRRSFLLVAVLWFACLGCLSSRKPATSDPQGADWPYVTGQCPRFLILYLPYPQNGAPLALPSPTTPGWTDQRMERDVSRILGAGLDGIVLGIQPETLADTFQTERVVRFAQLVASRAPAGFGVVLMIVPSASSPVSMDAEAIGQWLSTSGIQNCRALQRQAGRVVVMLSPQVSLSGAPHPAALVVPMGSASSSWRWQEPAAVDRFTPTAAPDGQLVVYGGWRGPAAPGGNGGSTPWEMERRRGKALQEELSRAFAARALTICISSWNNYVTGDFVEPNTLDGDAVLKRLTAVIREAKDSCR